jgi:hypothetical protein
MTLENIKAMADANLEVSTWKNRKGDRHVTLTRVKGDFRKNIAIPVDVLSAVLDAMREEADKAA